MNCVHWRHEGSSTFPSWRDREDYLERFGPRALLWVGELRETQAWGWTPPALCIALRGRVQIDNRGCSVELGASDVLLTAPRWPQEPADSDHIGDELERVLRDWQGQLVAWGA